MSGCLVHESGRAFGCKACDAVLARLAEPGWRNLAWLRSRVLELEALRCTGGSGCPAHLVLNVEDNAKGCEHGILVGHCNRCQRVIAPGDTHAPKSAQPQPKASDTDSSSAAVPGSTTLPKEELRLLRKVVEEARDVAHLFNARGASMGERAIKDLRVALSDLDAETTAPKGGSAT